KTTKTGGIMLTPLEGHESAKSKEQETRSFHQYLKIGDISTYLNIKSKTLYAMVESGDIPYYRIGRLIRFKREDVDLWMEAKKVIGINPRGTSKRAFRSSKRNQYIDKVVRKTIDGLMG
ncbi:MAG: helix-turn-helix domain-containing protein, partial [Deltaproteobacteria bacterium]|nr:helix-turn-helix domain-containing protein [Deltaproteobacteria bacterium]